MDDLLAKLSQRLGADGLKPRDYIRWVQASVGPNIRMIPTSDVLFFRAEDKYTRVQTEKFEALIRKPIKELIDELDPDEFWQIHRGTVVRVDAVEQVSRNLRGHQVVHLKGTERAARGQPHLQSPVQADVGPPASRRRVRALRRSSASDGAAAGASRWRSRSSSRRWSCHEAHGALAVACARSRRAAPRWSACACTASGCSYSATASDVCSTSSLEVALEHGIAAQRAQPAVEARAKA